MSLPLERRKAEAPPQLAGRVPADSEPLPENLIDPKP